MWVDPDVYLRELLEDGEYEEAAAFLGHIAEEDPGNGDVRALWAICLRALDQEDEALARVTEALTVDPRSPYVHWVHGALLEDRKRYAEAEKAARTALELEPGYLLAHVLLAQTFIGRGKWREALEAAEAALAIDPEEESAQTLRALALRYTEGGEEWSEAVASLLDRYPTSGWARTGLGWSALETGDADAARQHFEQAIALDPTSEWARAGLIEATKASNPVYRQILRFFLAFGRMSGRTRWGIILGGILAYRYLNGWVRENPDLALLAYPVMAAWVAFILLSWTVGPLSDFVLTMDPEGRRLVSPQRKTAGYWVAGTVGSALFLGGLAWITGVERVAVSALAAAFLVIPMSAVFQCEAGWPRKVMAAYTGVLVVALVAGLLGPGEISGVAMGLAIVGSVLGSWVGVFLSSRTVRR